MSKAITKVFSEELTENIESIEGYTLISKEIIGESSTGADVYCIVFREHDQDENEAWRLCYEDDPFLGKDTYIATLVKKGTKIVTVWE